MQDLLDIAEYINAGGKTQWVARALGAEPSSVQAWSEVMRLVAQQKEEE